LIFLFNVIIVLYFLSILKWYMIMVFTKMRKKLRCLAFAMLLWQALGLFFCGDVDCLHGEGDEVCQTPLCSFLNSHNHSQPLLDFSQDDSCQCACCFSVVVPEIQPFSASFRSSQFSIEPQLFSSIPASGIDHIPRV